MFDQLGFGEGGLACFVDKRRERAKRRQRRHQLQQLEIEAFAGRDAPAHVIASLHARHLVWTLGRNEAGKNSSFGMTVRAPPRRARPCPSMASAMDLRPKKSAAYPRTGGRCALSGDEATADRPCHARLSTTTAAPAMRASRQKMDRRCRAAMAAPSACSGSWPNTLAACRRRKTSGSASRRSCRSRWSSAPGSATRAPTPTRTPSA